MTKWLIGVLAAALVLAGCGGDSGSSASEDYVNSACGDLSTWVTDVDGAISSLTDAGLATDKEDVRSAVDQATDATDELLSSLEELGLPETDAGQQAKSGLDRLGATLRQQIETIEQALEAQSGPVAVAATVTAALSTAASAVESTYNDLRGLDPGGELEDAFVNADDCESLREQVDEIG